jgi:hypothetical protein
MPSIGLVTFISFRLENTYHEYVENTPISASNRIIGDKMMIRKAIDRLLQRTEKEAHLGVERTAWIHRRSFDHSGIYTTGMASVQAEECA